MPWVYNKNSILTNKGNVDCFCLACETHLKNEEEVDSHIKSQTHKENLEVIPYVEDFMDECLRKVKKGYYCEYCNILFKTSALLSLHIIEQNHIDNRQTKCLRRMSTSIVFKNLVISEKSWNCIVDETCMICMLEFDDADQHIKDPEHVINLVKSNVEFGKEEMLYRMINNTSFQCLTCNSPLALGNINTHPFETEHKEKYDTCKRAYLTIKQNDNKNKTAKEEPKPSKSEPIPKVTEELVTPKKTVTSKTPDKYDNQKEGLSKKSLEEELCEVLGAVNYIAKDENDMSWCMLCDWSFSDASEHLKGRHHEFMLFMHQERELKRNSSKPVTPVVKPKPHKAQSDPINLANILDSLTKFQSNDMNLNFENETAMCKKCNKNVDFTFEAIVKHIEEHKPAKTDDPVKKNVQKARKTSEASSTSSKDTEEELAKIVKQHDLVPATKGKMYCKYCDTNLSASLKNLTDHVNGNCHKNKVAKSKSQKTPMHTFIQHVTGCKDGGLQVVINEKYCVNIFSFSVVTKDYKLRCEVCELDLEMSQFYEHVTSSRHGVQMAETQVLMALDTEFVREIHQNKYHCGYCNIVTESFEALELHLDTVAHAEAKNVATWRLQQYLPRIAMERKTEKDNFNLIQLLTNEHWY